MYSPQLLHITRGLPILPPSHTILGTNYPVSSVLLLVTNYCVYGVIVSYSLVPYLITACSVGFYNANYPPWCGVWIVTTSALVVSPGLPACPADPTSILPRETQASNILFLDFFITQIFQVHRFLIRFSIRTVSCLDTGQDCAMSRYRSGLCHV